MRYKNPIPTIDVIIEKSGKIVLIKRRIEPFKGRMAIPGGYIEYKEKVEDAAKREAKEETGLKVKLKEILGVYSDLKRDPKKHKIAIAFAATPVGGKLKPSEETTLVNWVEIKKIDFKSLAFDHAKILKDYMKWKKKNGTYWSSK